MIIICHEAKFNSSSSSTALISATRSGVSTATSGSRSSPRVLSTLHVSRAAPGDRSIRAALPAVTRIRTRARPSRPSPGGLAPARARWTARHTGTARCHAVRRKPKVDDFERGHRWWETCQVDSQSTCQIDIQRPENHASCFVVNEVTFSANLIGVSSVDQI